MMKKPKTEQEACKKVEEEVLGAKRKVTRRRLSQINVSSPAHPPYDDATTTVGKGINSPLSEECLTY